MNTVLKWQPLRSPEPNRPFVNRTAEIDVVREKLRSGVQGKPMPLGVICYWGAFGMGKSWLLWKLENLYKAPSQERDAQGKYPTVTARLDLNPQILPDLWRDEKISREGVIKELWQQLARQMEVPVPDLEKSSADECAEAFVNQVTAWATDSVTPLIMLDTVDDVLTWDEGTFFWFEQNLVERLAMTDRVLFAFTSRGEIRSWRRFQVRRRVDSHRLTAFDADTAGKGIKASPSVSEVLYDHAFGHPLVTEYLGRALRERGVPLQQDAEVRTSIDTALVQPILREVVAEMLRGVEHGELAKVANVLRWVAVEPLRFLAEALKLEERKRGDAYYLGCIDKLQAHHLLYWNSSKNSYEPDPVLHHLITHFLELDTPEWLVQAHRAALIFHRERLEAYPAYLARYVPEVAYHSAVLDRRGYREPALAFESWWETFKAELAPDHAQPWKELEAALEQDKELETVIRPAVYNHLLSDIQQHAAGR
ncbi:MAG: hypothetical protein JXA42_08435 [Anaerolineales bacterium]|nr:hypothetical protein [Anaerolineales bacterium]